MDHARDSTFGWRCAVTIFVGAFLLFQVQPLISKMILPWFGGSPAVWTTCMLFFQTALLLGYCYADRLVHVQRSRWRLGIHLALLIVAVCLLPITRAESFQPADSSHPTWKILVLLGCSVGLPYLAVSTTGPLVQVWFAAAYPDRSPYRLYALSNVGSLAALLSYPVLVEPFFSTRTQGYIWSAMFLVYAAMTGWLAFSIWNNESTGEKLASKPSDERQDVDDERATVQWMRVTGWFLWPAFASMMLLAVTNQLCQNVAVIPFLWIAPLSLYLISFIICFDNPRWYVGRWYGLGAALSILLVSNLLLSQHIRNPNIHLPLDAIATNVLVQIVSYLAVLFFVCMVCHGEVVRQRPPAKYLTSFYLVIAAGGAIGGMFVTLACPKLFSSYFELNLGLVIGFVSAATVALRDAWPVLRTIYRVVVAIAVPVGFVIVLVAQWFSLDKYWLVMERNFYGVMTIEENYASEGDLRHGYMLYSGSEMHRSVTMHGYQLLSREGRRQPTMYYLPDSGIGVTLRHFPRRTNRRVGIIGLGAGTIATYGEPGDEYVFYEINPVVEKFADLHFSFLRDSKADVEVVSGDGRLMLANQPSQKFDVLVLDAFSGDAIPAHLLTREAFELYVDEHLKEDGVLAVHVSNRYLDLTPVIARLAEEFEMPCVLIRNQAREMHLYESVSDWLLLTRNQLFLELPAVREAANHVASEPTFPLWTDQYNNLFRLLWRGREP